MRRRVWLCRKCGGRSKTATVHDHACCGSHCDRICTPCSCVNKPEKCTCKGGNHG